MGASKSQKVSTWHPPKQEFLIKLGTLWVPGYPSRFDLGTLSKQNGKRNYGAFALPLLHAL
eukprot:1464536-Rhodomonas_salina.1